MSEQNFHTLCWESSSVKRINEAMAEFSGDSFEAGDAEDKGLPLKPHAQAHLLSATEYCKVWLDYCKMQKERVLDLIWFNKIRPLKRFMENINTNMCGARFG